MIATILTILSISTSAAVPNFYACQVILTAKDLAEGSVLKQFSAPSEAGTHGGEGFEFSFENHRVGVLSDSKWLALSWQRDGKYIAQATVAASEANEGSRVLIVANPNDPEEQVALSCNVP